MSLFPTLEYSPLLTSYFKDQSTKLYNYKGSFDKHDHCTSGNMKPMKRQNPEYRERENELRRKRRAHPEYRTLENEKKTITEYEKTGQ